MLDFQKNKQITVICLITLTILMLGLTYGFVPLYRLFCQITGYGGTLKEVDYSMLLDRTTTFVLDQKVIKLSLTSTVSDELP
jgi:cytochrome c oxidase assembly protein subunit 11